MSPNDPLESSAIEEDRPASGCFPIIYYVSAAVVLIIGIGSFLYLTFGIEVAVMRAAGTLLFVAFMLSGGIRIWLPPSEQQPIRWRWVPNFVALLAVGASVSALIYWITSVDLDTAINLSTPALFAYAPVTKWVSRQVRTHFSH